MKWSSFFKYLGTPVSGIEGLSFLEDFVVANATKIGGDLGSARRPVVAVPLFRIVDLDQSLVIPIAQRSVLRGFHFCSAGILGFPRCANTGGG